MRFQSLLLTSMGVKNSTRRERLGTKKDTSELARAMRDEGMTLQQIAEELGDKNRSSVIEILNKES